MDDAARLVVARGFARELSVCISAPVSILFGGSRAIGESGPWSDDDWYIYVPNFFYFWRLRRAYDTVVAIKKKCDVSAQCMVVWPGLMQSGLISLYAYDELGICYSSHVDAAFLAINFLKVACESYARSLMGGPESGYRLGKSALYLLSSQALMAGWEEAGVHPLVAMKKIGNWCNKYPDDASIDRLGKIMQYKSTGGLAQDIDYEIVRETLLKSIHLVCLRHLPWRNQFLSIMLAPTRLQKRWWNHDKVVLRNWAEYIQGPNTISGIMALSKYTAYAYFL
jgi:hypothetical protein